MTKEAQMTDRLSPAEYEFIAGPLIDSRAPPIEYARLLEPDSGWFFVAPCTLHSNGVMSPRVGAVHARKRPAKP